jgi:spore coat protein H
MIVAAHALLLLACASFDSNGPPQGSGEVEQVPGVSTGQFDPDVVTRVDLTMAPEDFDSLRGESESFVSVLGGDCMESPVSGSYTTFGADISWDGEALSNIGIRKKGLIGSQSTSKPSFSINLDEFEEGASLHGTDNLILNNSVQDPTLMRQCLTYGLFAQAGLPAPRCNFARVSMNGDDMGLYVHVEPVRKAFLRANFTSDEGDLYEGAISDVRDGWTRTFDPDTDQTDPEMASIHGLVDAINEGGDLDESLSGHLNVEAYLDFWAMEVLTGHWDGHNGNRNNFYVYDVSGGDGFTFIPWGTDGAMPHTEPDYQDNLGVIYAKAILPNLFLSDGSGRDRFEARVQTLLDTVWDEEAIHTELERMLALIQGEIDYDEGEMYVDGLRGFIDGQRAALEASLPGEAWGLENPYCLMEVGEISVSFETTWGSYWTATDWSTEGTAEMTASWEGDPIEFMRTGAVVGDLDEEGEDALIGFLGVVDPIYQVHLLPYLIFDPDLLTVGQVMDVDAVSSSGNLLYMDSNTGGEWVQAGYLGGGTLELDELDTSWGGTMRGNLSTYIWTWMEV